MLTFRGPAHRHCDGVTRRDALRVGGLGAAGLTLADILRADAAAPARRPRSVVYIVLSGGPSHIDTWDMKPDAPAEYRGAFKPAPSKVPGLRVCELMPRQAAIMDKLTVLRGVRSVETDHFLSEVYTGLPRSAGPRPAFGAAAGRLLPAASRIPGYVSLRDGDGTENEYEQPHYAGAAHAPFRPAGPALGDMTPVADLPRLADRTALLNGFDDLRRGLDRAGDGGFDGFRRQALEVITSPAVRDAFDLSKEPAKVVARYGTGTYTHQADASVVYPWDAKRFVLARRLVEAGVRVVTVRVGAWDHHFGPKQDIFASYRHVLPALDASFAALVSDLAERGLLDDVLVVMLGEFGRTPKVEYPGPGRNHWADAGCAVVAGGGAAGGRAIGETTARAERSTTGAMTFQNVMATVYAHLGVDPRAQIPDLTGRPQHLLDDPTPVRGLL